MCGDTCNILHLRKSFVLSKQVKMANQKLTLEIPESLFEELQHLAELTDQSVKYLALQSIANSLPPIARKYSEKNMILMSYSQD